MQRHPHLQRSRLLPWIRSERVLRVNGTAKGSRRRWKSSLNCIPDVLVEGATVGRNSGLQQGIVPRDRGTHRDRITLPEPGASSDIGKEKGDGA
jgi:hypothetical protein